LPQEAIDVVSEAAGRSTLQMRLTEICVCILAGVAVAAQGAAASQDAGDAAATSKTAGQMTVTGCLQRTEVASTPATGAPGAANLPPGFVLINAKSATAESQPADVTTYVLDGGDLASIVGRRVEIKGTLMPSPTGTSGKTAPAERHEAGTVTADTPGSVSSSSSESPRLHVISARAVGDCSSSQ